MEIGLARADGFAEITVADTGIGIDPAEVERIFEPFHRLDAARAHDTGGAGHEVSAGERRTDGAPTQ